MNRRKEKFTPEPAMCQLFRQELSAVSSVLYEMVKKIKNGEMQSVAIVKVIELTRSLRTASCVMQFAQLNSLLEGLCLFLQLVQKKLTTRPLDDIIPLLLQVANKLQEIASYSDGSFYVKSIENDSDIDILIGKFKVMTAQPKASHKEVLNRRDDQTIAELFKAEMETLAFELDSEMIALEESQNLDHSIPSLMRLTHSIKGAARAAQLESVVQIAHTMESCLTALQEARLPFNTQKIDLFFKAIDFFKTLANQPIGSIIDWAYNHDKEAMQVIAELQEMLAVDKADKSMAATSKTVLKVPRKPENSDDVEMLRVSTRNLNRLVSFAGETSVESQWLQKLVDDFIHLKRQLNDCFYTLEVILDRGQVSNLGEVLSNNLLTLQQQLASCRNEFNHKLADLDLFANWYFSLSERFFKEMIDSRMRPFGDIVISFPRMVRDLAHLLKKQVHLKILGKNTLVDRDVLEKLEAPLGHLVRNAIDHGIESPEERLAAGKSVEGVISVEAQHRAGKLVIAIADDGKGLDLEAIKKKIIEKKMISSERVETLSESDLMEFLFFPGFTTTTTVSDVSGRGVGLNVVQNMIGELQGSVKISSVSGKGVSLEIQLPLTLSLLRVLVVAIKQELFAFPFTYIDSSLVLQQDQIKTIGELQYFEYHKRDIRLIEANQVLGLSQEPLQRSSFFVVVIHSKENSYGVVVDRFVEEKELLIKELDPRLGKVECISSGALMQDGSLVLILDVEEMLHKIEKG